MELISIPLLPILMLVSQFLAGGVHGFNQSKAKVPAVLAFGDSIMDTGNNNYIPTLIKSNFPPYGKDFPDGKATGRFSNGKITSDFIASEVGVKPLLPPYLDPLLDPEELLTVRWNWL